MSTSTIAVCLEFNRFGSSDIFSECADTTFSDWPIDTIFPPTEWT